jgi:hypothetical protein
MTTAQQRDQIVRIHDVIGRYLPVVSGPSLARTRPITAVSRSQYSVSAASCFSPVLVML